MCGLQNLYWLKKSPRKALHGGHYEVLFNITE